MSDQKDQNIGKWTDPGLTDQQREELKNELSSEERKEAERAWEISGRFAPPEGLDQESRWERLEKTMDEEPLIIPLYQSKPFRTAVGFLVAASVLLIALFYLKPSDYRWDSTVNTLAGEVKEVSLPDGSTVTLNAMSSLEYSTRDFSRQRKLRLEGEAFFEVTRNSTPFSVEAGDISVEVLGTSFNLARRNQDTRVGCATGKVQVSSSSGQVILTPGRGTKVAADLSPTPPFEIPLESIGSWRRGEFYFDERPLDQVFEEIGRQFGITVESQFDLTTLKFTGYFQNDDLEKALSIVCLSAGFNFKQEEGKVIIY